MSFVAESSWPHHGACKAPSHSTKPSSDFWAVTIAGQMQGGVSLQHTSTHRHSQHDVVASSACQLHLGQGGADPDALSWSKDQQSFC